MSHGVLNLGLIDLIEKNRVEYFSDFDFSTLIYTDANLWEFVDTRNNNYNLISQLVSSDNKRVTRVGRVPVMCKRVATPFGSHHNAVVNHPVSSFGMSGERSYLPDTGSRVRNNKRILGIEPAMVERDRRADREKEDTRQGEE